MMRKTPNNFSGTGSVDGALPVSPLAYCVEDAANAVGLSRSPIYELIAEDEIVPCKVGNRMLIPIAELTALLDRHRVDPAAGRETAPTPQPQSGLEKKRRR